MTKIKDDAVKSEDVLGFGTDDLSGEEAHKIAQELVKEFINTKQRMLTDDRKLNAIGKALIEQKGALESILSVQDSHGKEISESLEVVAEKQEGVSDKISSISQSMMELQEAKVEQDKFLGELGHFKGKHDELTQNSKIQSNQSVERLKAIGGKVDKLFEQINNVDIEDRVEDISKRTIEIDELLKDHASKQEQAREDASRNMLDLLAEVTSFRRQLSDEGLVGRLADIQSESYESKQKIDSLNEKFDTFIEIYELYRVEVKDSLEDVFPDTEDNLFDEIEEYIEEEAVEETLEGETLEEVDLEDNSDTGTKNDSLLEEINEEPSLDTEELAPSEEVDELTIEELDQSEEINNFNGESDEIEDDEEEYYTSDSEEEIDADNIEEYDGSGNEDEVEEFDMDGDSDRLNELSIEESSNSLSLEDIEEIPVYGRVEKDDPITDSRKDKKKQGFFSKLFGGR